MNMFVKIETARIYCEVPYKQKEIAKSYGAKFNADNKTWYFDYPLNSFLNDETNDTFVFKPLFSFIINDKKTLPKISEVYYIACKRYNKKGYNIVDDFEEWINN